MHEVAEGNQEQRSKVKEEKRQQNLKDCCLSRAANL